MTMDFQSIYYPGKLIVLTNELFNMQKIIQKDNNVDAWKNYVKRYFNEDSVYSVIMNRENRTWTFNSGFKTLPLVFKSKFEENLTFIGAYLESPEEYSVDDGKFLLVIPNFTLMEKYSDNFVTTHGSLRILYDVNFKIKIYEFTSREHQEYPTKDPNNSLVNEFGITPQFSRTLIICEAMTEMMENMSTAVSNFKN